MFAGVVFSVFSLTLIGVSGQHLNSSCIDCDCCIGGQCNLSGDDQTCDYGCTDGHWGSHCMYDCVHNCTPCYQTNGLCQTCVDGVYGSYCNNTCLPNCAKCSGGTSCSTCKDGFYRGRYHDLSGATYFNDCHLECQDNCKRCYSYDYCQEWNTMSGKHVNSSCIDCDCCNGGVCDRTGDDKTCDYGCTDGHWGSHCMFDCVHNCPCYEYNGLCKTCMDGLYGSYCNNTCLSNCATCSSSTYCSTCKDGFYKGRYHDLSGTTNFYDCHLECQANCTKCSSYGSCQEWTTGPNQNSSCVNCSCCTAGSCILGNDSWNCDFGCTDGHWGTHCMYDCGQNCERCSQTTGICSECVGGLYGPYCNNTCLARCATCVNSYRCTTCNDGLYIGKYKDHIGAQTIDDCQLACPVNCTKCSSFGKCTNCKKGNFGTTCSSQCSQGCANNVCTQPNGYCECTEGFEGLRCDNCISGIEGDKCVLGKTAAKDDNSVVMYVLVGVTCLVTGILIAIGVVMCIRYQRKRYGVERSETGDIQDGVANDQQVSNTNLSLATFVNQGADDNISSEHHYTSLHGRNTENHQTGSFDNNIEPDYETPRNYK